MSLQQARLVNGDGISGLEDEFVEATGRRG